MKILVFPWNLLTRLNISLGYTKSPSLFSVVPLGGIPLSPRINFIGGTKPTSVLWLFFCLQYWTPKKKVNPGTLMTSFPSFPSFPLGTKRSWIPYLELTMNGPRQFSRSGKRKDKRRNTKRWTNGGFEEQRGVGLPSKDSGGRENRGKGTNLPRELFLTPWGMRSTEESDK